MDSTKNTKHINEEKARQFFPGSAVDAAYDNKVDKNEVKQDVKELNDNPRDNSLDE